MANILVVEDEPAIAESLAYSLRRDGYGVQTAGTLGEAERAVGKVDLVILDLMLPDGSGFELLAQLRRRPEPPAVIILSSRDQEADRVAGLETGADDYVTKPFSMRELLLRIKVAQRRVNREDQDDRILVMGPVVIDTSRCLVTVNGEEVILTTTEYKLLCALAERRGRIQTRDNLLKQVWGYSSNTDTRTVDSHITRIRTKLGLGGDLIKTVRGFGYKMEEE